MKKLCLYFVFVCVAFAFSLVAPLRGSAEDSTTIGALLPLTGNFAPVGEDNRQGIEIALEEMGRPKNISLVYGDSKAEGYVSVTEFKKMVETEKVSGVFAFRSPVGMAINPLSKRMQVPILGGVGHKDFAAQNEYAFQVWPLSDKEGAFLAHEILRLGYKKIALLTIQDEWTSSVSDGVREALKGTAATIVFDQELTPAENDARTLLSQAQTKGAEALFLNVGITQMGHMLRQARELKIKASLFGNFWVGKKDVLKSAGESAEGVIFPEMVTDYPALTSVIQKKFNSTPSGATISSYVSMLFLGQAIGDTTASLNPAQLYKRLLNISEIKTKSGNFKINNRCIELPMTLKVIRSGKVEVYGKPM